jgi:hypothetical protein
VTESDRIGRILWAAIAVCLLAGLVSVPIVGDGTGGEAVQADGQRVGSVGDSSSTSVVDGVRSDGGDGGGGDGGDGGGAPAGGGDGRPPAAAPPTTVAAKAATGAPTTAAPAVTAAPTTTAVPEDLGPPKDPGPAKPSRAGTYRYKVTSSDGKTTDATTQVVDKGTSGGETRQVVKLRGQGFDADNDVAWRPDGVYVLVSNVQFGNNQATCDWNPDTVQLRLPLAAGTTWESSSTCTFTFGTTPVTVVRKVTGRIVELRRVRVAGQVVDVWAIDGTEHVEFAGGSVDSAGTSLFSPKHGLVVRSDTTIKGSGPQGAQEGTASTEIQNLDPE